MTRIEKETKVSSAELTLYTYPVSEHKMSPIALPTENYWRVTKRRRSLKTDTGYRLSVSLDETGDPVHLEITAPKYRETRPPQRTVCGECGIEWMRGDPES